MKVTEMDIFNMDDNVFIYKTMLLVEALYQAGIYVEDKENVLNKAGEIKKKMELAYGKELL